MNGVPQAEFIECDRRRDELERAEIREVLIEVLREKYGGGNT